MFSLQGAEISHFLFAMGCLWATAHLLGYLAERLFIPRVIGEVSAGLLLGPTFLGHFFPNLFHWIFLGFQDFFAILVMLALVTSWFPGTWLRFVLQNGWKLMPGDENIKELQEENKKNIKSLH